MCVIFMKMETQAANTMFKLTYQAYIMFGILMGYAIFRLLTFSRQKILKICAGAALFFLLWTVGYFGNSVRAWFGEVWKPEKYQGLNAVTFPGNRFSGGCVCYQMAQGKYRRRAGCPGGKWRQLYRI